MLRKKIALLISFCIIFTSLVTTVPQIEVHATTTSYYVSTTGIDSNPGTQASPFLTIGHARDVVRTINSNMTNDIIIYLRGGTYTQTSTLAFNQSDSGTNGYNIIYQNYTGETAIISGGQTITGWSVFDAQKNIYRASVDASLETRQLYVDGVRGVRARSDNLSTSTAKYYDGGGVWVGYTNTVSGSQNWGNQTDIELVFGKTWFTEPRNMVSSITSAAIILNQDCWNNQWLKGCFYPAVGSNNVPPPYLENAYELLDQEGEWYLNRTTDYIYYKPRTGENMATASITVAKLDGSLVSIAGAIDNLAHNIIFQGISFSYATWMEPSLHGGFAQAQCGYVPYGNFGIGGTWEAVVQLPSNIRLNMAKDIQFIRNKFIHLGASALHFDVGCMNNTVCGNEFTDISGSAVTVGISTVDGHHPDDVRKIVKNNIIKNNYIHKVGAEYSGSYGVLNLCADGTEIAHNEICDMPYTGISSGYWGTFDFAETPYIQAGINNAVENSFLERSDPGTTKNTKIVSNHIHHVQDGLYDGGGIYTIGAQPGSLVEGNVIHDIIDGQSWGLYLDEQTRYMTFRNNIVYGSHSTTDTTYPAYNMIVHSTSDNDVEDNYVDKLDYQSNPEFFNMAFSGLFTNHHIIADGNIPNTILDNAGLETDYIDLLPQLSVNYAIGKPTVAYYPDGSTVMSSVIGTLSAGVDGIKGVSSGNYVAGIGAHNWIYQIDLGSVRNINRVITQFYDNGVGWYATEYAILVSTTDTLPGSFTEVKHVTGCNGGISEQTFTPADARYVRIKAIKPDGAGQTGNEMYINECEVYGYNNLAYKRNITAYKYVGGVKTAATMVTGFEKEKAVDGKGYTSAQVSGSSDCMYEIDLGSVREFVKLRVMTVAGYRASSIQILASTTTNADDQFTSVSTVNDYYIWWNFPATVARYLRIRLAGISGNDVRLSDVYLLDENADDRALAMSGVTDNTTGNDKYICQSVSASSFTFQTGDIISYDVKLLSNSNKIGGFDVKNSDSSRFSTSNLNDQNGIAWFNGDLRSNAYRKWYHRELTVPSGLNGKTAAKWMLVLDNDDPLVNLQALYDNIVVKRGGSVVLTIYHDGAVDYGTPSANTTEYISHYNPTSAQNVTHYFSKPVDP